LLTQSDSCTYLYSVKCKRKSNEHGVLKTKYTRKIMVICITPTSSDKTYFRSQSESEHYLNQILLLPKSPLDLHETLTPKCRLTKHSRFIIFNDFFRQRS